ncbi:MAG: fructosamine kinase family protein [Verrucomicrobia bacterium]|nr:fructosamine kinase family protein [Verrucomicrobiota bacterium]
MNPLDGAIAAALGSPPLASQPVGGGCIHHARQLDLADGRRVFVKSACGGQAALLVAEARGLALLAPHLRVPQVCGTGTTADGTRWLALEWLDLHPLTTAAWADLGRQLAALHAVTAARPGLDHDNFIGATPQSNQAAATWLEFYLHRRLRPQIRLALAQGHALPEAEMLALAERRLAAHEPAAALLHGDLWSGNAAALPAATAVVFDPAPYHGDPETDLAMLELFGGPLPEAFFRGYGLTAPDRTRRRPLYDLYHALNHLNLFGSGYASMVRRCLDALRI